MKDETKCTKGLEIIKFAETLFDVYSACTGSRTSKVHAKFAKNYKARKSALKSTYCKFVTPTKG
jgi:hypothetical protein